MADVTEKLNKLEFTMRYKAEVNGKEIIFDCQGWDSALNDIITEDMQFLNLCSCNVGRYWEEFEDDEPWEKRKILLKIVKSIRAVRDRGNCPMNMISAGISEVKNETGLFPFQHLLLKYCDREMMKYIMSNGYILGEEGETAAKKLGSEANLEVFVEMLEAGC